MADAKDKAPGELSGGMAKRVGVARALVVIQQANVDAGKGPGGALTTAEREELARLREQGPADGARDIKKSDGLLRQGDDVKFAFIAVEKAWAPVAVLCKVLKVSRSGFYAWERRVPSARSLGDAKLRVHITAIHERNRGTYGSPRVHAELRALGLVASRKRVARLMRELGLASRRKRRFKATTDSRHDLHVAENLLDASSMSTRRTSRG